MRSPLVAIALLCGCSNGVVSQGAVSTGGGAVTLAWASLDRGLLAPPASLDVLVASPTRGEVDVLVESDDGSWVNTGSFYAGGSAIDLAVGHVGGRGAVAARDQGGSVSLLVADADMPHRLTFPIYIYRRLRNGQPVDDSPPSRALALADLNGDGSDELLVATDWGVLTVENLEQFIGANAEHPPPGSGQQLDDGHPPDGVAAVDVDGDGRLDVIALDRQTPALRIWMQADGGHFSHQTVPLPAAPSRVVASTCAGVSARVLLDDGRVYALGPDAKLSSPLSMDPKVATLIATRDALALAAAPIGDLRLSDACAKTTVDVATPTSLAADLRADTSFDRLALLSTDATTINLYRIFTGF